VAIVLQISDTHLRAEPNKPVRKNPDATLAASIAAVADVAPDLVLLTGDLADDGSVAALARLQAMVAPFAAPTLAIAGNHDDLGNVRSVFGEVSTAEVGAWRVVAVETMIRRRIHGAVDVAALCRRLDALDQRPTVIAVHHPPRSPSTHRWFRLTGATAMLAALHERPHVRAVVSGHLHEVFRYREDGLELCGAPSAYYAIEHVGESYEVAPDGLVGTQLLTLGDDGSFACEPVARSLGC
jgi:Icc protein